MVVRMRNSYKLLIFILSLSAAACGFFAGTSNNSNSGSTTNYRYFAYVMNSSTDNISIYEMSASTGAFTEISGSPFASGGTGPDYLDITPNFTYMYIAHGGASSVRYYSLNRSTGAPTFVNSWISGLTDDTPAIHSGGTFLYTKCGGPAICGYTIDATGAQTNMAGMPYATAGTLNNVVVTPNGSYVYANNNGGNNIYGFSVTAGTGVLVALGGSPFATAAGTRWVSVSADGTFLMASNGASNSASTYSINGAGALSLINTVTTGGAGGNANRIAISPLGTCAYVTNSSENTIGGYTVSSGTLAAAAGSPYTVTNFPRYPHIDPTGSFLYIANNNNNVVDSYRINADCSITALSGFPLAAPDPFSMKIVRVSQ